MKIRVVLNGTLLAYSKQIGPDWAIVGQNKTYFSEFMVLQSPDGQRTVVKHLLPDSALSPNDLGELQWVTESFITMLRAFGVDQPASQLAMYQENLFMVSDYVGPDLEEVLIQKKDDPKFVRDVLYKVIYMTRQVLLQDQSDLSVGLDLQLSNFGHPDVGMPYLDPFPPLVRNNGRYWVHYPQPMDEQQIHEELDRKFKRFGTLRRMRFDVMRIHPRLVGIFEDCVRQVLGSVGEELVNGFNLLPDCQIANLSRDEACQFIGSLTVSDKDVLRELGARLIPINEMRQKSMEVVFALTRADRSPGFQQSHADRVEILKQWLKTLV